MKRGTSKNNPLTEKETRQKYFDLAKELKCEKDLVQIFDRYDNLLKRCSNATERQQIAIMANIEVHKLFNFTNSLVVAGKEILPGNDLV